jgi:hypothetical protein
MKNVIRDIAFAILAMSVFILAQAGAEYIDAQSDAIALDSCND